MARLTGVHETVLYGPDVPALAAFYTRVIGLREVGTTDSLSAALRLPEGDAVLLLFDPARASAPSRGVPSHGAVGPGHVAFRVPAGELEAWRRRLDEEHVAIESEREWARGGRSIYVRDSAGNSVELVEGRVWPA